MKLKILDSCGHGLTGYQATSLLFNEEMLIDAGAINQIRNTSDLVKISDIFITHSHLDHIAGLPFMIDNTFAMRAKPINIYGLKYTMNSMMEHIFNNSIWPDFSKLPTVDNGQFITHDVIPEEVYKVKGLEITPIQVEHTVPTVGYRVSDGKSSVIFSADTCSTDRIWEVINNDEQLKLVIFDLAFSNEEKEIATASKHMTFDNTKEEIKKLTRDCEVVTFHYKDGWSEELVAKIAEIKTPFGRSLRPVKNGEEFNF